MEFILQQQAKTEGQKSALRTMVRTGMKMIVKQVNRSASSRLTRRNSPKK